MTQKVVDPDMVDCEPLETPGRIGTESSPFRVELAVPISTNVEFLQSREQREQFLHSQGRVTKRQVQSQIPEMR
jgi:hypothetical protein